MDAHKVENRNLDASEVAPGDHKLHQSRRGLKLVFSVLLRLFGVVLLVPALLLMVTDRQTTRVAAFDLEAKYTYSKAFQAFVGACVICACHLLMSSIVSLLFICTRSKFMRNRFTAWLLFLTDQLMTYLLLGAIAASTQVAYIAKKGSVKVGWYQVCQNFNRFCNHIEAALALGYLALLLLAICTLMSVQNLVYTSRLHHGTGYF
ncbi:hypothetical protein O6H91_02G100100 [Diphasiastrum complanatum]|uniref:Uncharacterized protein n=1 Tax=Diphasiastrum complanatum TaxID=34168 RepID=A0ACC2EII6_DIPCM|nr:hypothetical protein O6H91_02G100100 [Diphasiastrum complanatum]